MSKNKKLPDNQITVYQTPDGKINIEVLYANENIWLPQKRIAELFDVDRSVVTRHLKNIFSENELQEDSVCAKFAHTAEDGEEIQTKFYSPDMLHKNETRTLTRLRDTLLPKLMSGEIRVKFDREEAGI